ncbi:uncharacterized protein TNCV_1433221 [Trichonephila clavipes]|nr:uncharacterized protein TNCV_1433221 [Trichonephila clavipes]
MYDEVCDFDPGPSRWVDFYDGKKSSESMSYDYVACIRTLEYLFGLGALDKIKYQGIPEEDMGVCKCIVPLRHGGTLNSRRAASPLVRLVEGEERWEAPDQPQGVLPQNWGEAELNRSVTSIYRKPYEGSLADANPWHFFHTWVERPHARKNGQPLKQVCPIHNSPRRKCLLERPLAENVKEEKRAARRLHESNLFETSSLACNVVGSIAYLATLNLNTLSHLHIPNFFLELIGNKREFIFPRKTPKKISGRVPYRFVTIVINIGDKGVLKPASQFEQS